MRRLADLVRVIGAFAQRGHRALERGLAPKRPLRVGREHVPRHRRARLVGRLLEVVDGHRRRGRIPRRVGRYLRPGVAEVGRMPRPAAIPGEHQRISPRGRERGCGGVGRVGEVDPDEAGVLRHSEARNFGPAGTEVTAFPQTEECVTGDSDRRPHLADQGTGWEVTHRRTYARGLGQGPCLAAIRRSVEPDSRLVAAAPDVDTDRNCSV